MSNVHHEIDGAIGRITLNRPERMNAVSVPLARELGEAIRQVGNHRDVRVVVIRGAGGNFCAGGDFDEVQRLKAEGPTALHTLFAAFRCACQAIENARVPVVAAVEGVAMAGGFELMQSADIVLVRDDARIADNHINFGMIPGGGGSARLPRIVGKQLAMALLLSGERLSGNDAVARGLAYRSFPPESFEEDVETFLVRLAKRDPSAVSAIKQLVKEGLTYSLSRALTNETNAVVEHICSPVGHDSVAAFKDREVRA
ncbi:enoyl-CoA hydratase/isomerase [Mycobacteroides abscessus subsp. abscessus]|uniref:Enoyl-CoA hydratase/isomerase n=1 Tax=Mycobacteroides abscessus TaxID=36809 RepID=A0A0U0ZNX3_9MYCO|nr:enoyl-CoA hydratase/isomerase family protein [Mycobacteroides abscessus]AKP57208.1 enoyl-CoA hydratase [Mycobacteroides abscessus UC22]MBL3736010.1 enoyl-CoA hydratase/isomerase family protein [Mycobacteroides abscessus subsp. massiliense]MBL3746490.1 enoyl-CoA hydratase/isomerase family protein [Mycobacteroides abscessus subsp. massiliense]MBL3760692.1 enoyl-CoA hydratase/isomerase family protein [Mycobacteroides abscessus subsp. massiliense]MBN7483329.1 enoyl-CoA hydratase/isomerase famil